MYSDYRSSARTSTSQWRREDVGQCLVFCLFVCFFLLIFAPILMTAAWDPQHLRKKEQRQNNNNNNNNNKTHLRWGRCRNLHCRTCRSRWRATPWPWTWRFSRSEGLPSVPPSPTLARSVLSPLMGQAWNDWLGDWDKGTWIFFKNSVVVVVTSFRLILSQRHITLKK